MSAPLPSPRAPLPALVTSLKRAGWGDLAGREWGGVRACLDALVARLPHKSGEGTVTVQQIADAAGVSKRWAARCLEVLESMGVIRWQRGGAVEGQPKPSFIRVVKKQIVALIELARPRQDARDAERRTITRERIKHLRYAFGWHREGRRAIESRERAASRRSHVEVAASLRPLRGESSGSRREVGCPQVAADAARAVGGSVASGSRPLPLSPDADPGVVECPHGYDARHRTRSGAPGCPFCRAAEADSRHSRRAAEDDGQAVVGAAASLAHLAAALTVGPG